MVSNWQKALVRSGRDKRVQVHTDSQILSLHEQCTVAFGHPGIALAPFHAASDPYGHARTSFPSQMTDLDQHECVDYMLPDYRTATRESRRSWSVERGEEIRSEELAWILHGRCRQELVAVEA